jgi:fission process protein 1
VFRDTWLRYAGYANEVGEACRGVLPLSLVHGSYGLVGLYVLADAIHKGRRASQVCALNCNEEIQLYLTLPRQSEHGSVAERRFDIVDRVADTLLWQTLASLLVPPLIINRTCKLTAFALGKYFHPTAYPSLTPRRRALVQTAVGLSIIPFIVHPIDHGVHFVLDHSSRALSGLIRRKYFTSHETTSKDHQQQQVINTDEHQTTPVSREA